MALKDSNTPNYVLGINMGVARFVESLEAPWTPEINHHLQTHTYNRNT